MTLPTNRTHKQPAPVRSPDPTDYGRWYRMNGTTTYYEGVAFVTRHDVALQLAERCRQLGARCFVKALARRNVLMMPEGAPWEAVELAERGMG